MKGMYETLDAPLNSDKEEKSASKRKFICRLQTKVSQTGPHRPYDFQPHQHPIY
jgi:hypothetical protein